MLMRNPNQIASNLSFPFVVSVVVMGFLLGFGVCAPDLLHAKGPKVVRAQSSDFDEEPAETEPPPKSKKGAAVIKTTAAVEEVAEEDMPANDPQPSAVLPERIVGNGFGSMGRASHLIGPTFGRNTSITPLEYMPYSLTDSNFFFADVRGFATNNSQAGGSLGLGYRRLLDDYNAWAGASLWYDGDQSTGRLYQQIGLSFEALINQLEIRSNVYLPVTSSQTYANLITNPAISGNQLLYTRTMDVGTALRGVDVEVGYSRPVLDKHIVRGFVGGYFFQGGSGSVTNVSGFKARIEGVINNAVTAQVLYTNDNLFGSNVMVGLSMQFPFGKDHPNTGWVRNTPSPFRFVERNYNVIVDRNTTSYANQVATDPSTGQPYLVEQVNSGATGPTPDGTTANPYSTVAAAQAAGGNIIFVQNGSVLNESITLSSGQSLIGQGAYNASVPTSGGGYVPMPPLAQSVTQVTPVIQNSAGNAITLASNTEVAGFNIIGSTGDGISGTGVSNVSLHDLMFSSIGGDAINITNATGKLNLSNIQVSSATGSGIVVSGGSPDLVFNGGGDTITSQGNGFALQNLTGGSVNLSNLSLLNNGGSGLVLDTVASNVTVNSLSVSQSGAAGSAVSITGDTGVNNVYNTYAFKGNTTITSPAGTGFSATNTDAIISVANLNVTSTSSNPAVSLSNAINPITFGNLNVNTQGGTGLLASSVTNLNVKGGTFTTVGAPAIDVASSGFNATLSSVSTSGGPYGIKIVNSTGNLTIKGNGGAGTGGTIQNTTTTGMILNSYGNTSINWMNFTNNAVGIQSTGTTSLGIANSQFNGSAGYAIDSMNDAVFSLVNSTLLSNGAVGGGTVRVQVNTLGTYTSNITNNTITDNNGSAIQLLTQGGGAGSILTLALEANTINGYNNGSPIFNMNWNGADTLTISGNTINAYGSGMTGMLIQDPTTTAVMTELVESNTIVFQSPSATSGTGIWMTNGQSGMTNANVSTYTIYNNAVKFEATGGTGLRFGFYDTTNSTVSTNLVTDLAGGATGMLYDNVAANSIIETVLNDIVLLAGDPLTHRGIIFTQATPTITLIAPTQQSQTNWVTNAASAATTFSIPTGTAIGGIVINDSYIFAQ